MAGYASIADVQAIIPRLEISATSVPTTTQVQGFIDQCAAEIEFALYSLGVTVPVTTPSWFVADMQRLNAVGAAAMAWMAAFPESVGPMGSGLGALLFKAYNTRLAELRDNSGVSSSLVLVFGEGAPRSYFTDIGAASDDSGVVDALGNPVYGHSEFSREKRF